MSTLAKYQLDWRWLRQARKDIPDVTWRLPLGYWQNPGELVLSEGRNYKLFFVLFEANPILPMAPRDGCEGGKQISFDNGLRWSLLVPGGLHVRKWSWNLVKNNRIKSIFWLTDISCITYRHLQNLFKLPIFLPIVWWNIYLVLPYQCIFMHKSFHLERKNYTICNFAVILIFLLPSDHVVEKMSRRK